MIASALLGMDKLEYAATSEELASAPLDEWTFDEQPQTGRAESEGTMIVSSASNHMVWVPNHDRHQKSAPVLPARPRYPVFGEEHNHDVDYSGDSTGDESNPAQESPEEPISEQTNPKDSEKGEAGPETVTNMGAGTIAKRNAVLTQAIMLDLAATK